MPGQEFRIDYFTEPTDSRWPEKVYPHFLLSYGDVGGTRTLDQDGTSYTYSIISKPRTYSDLESDIVKALVDGWGFKNTWQLRLSKSASGILEEDRQSKLQEILDNHNNEKVSRNLLV
jgi:hypothetical protein